jgi:CO/xanthine dehydrogenase FAD-binding subunit
MRGDVRLHDAVAPKTLNEALEILAKENGDYRPIAGGTDLMVLLETGTLRAPKLLSLHALKELSGIRQNGDSIDIGATTTFSAILNNQLIQKYFPLLAQAAASIGALAIQNRATIGGNIANASPAADSPPALLVYDAEIELVSKSGKRKIPYSSFHLGYKKTELRADELIHSIHLPISKQAASRQHFQKIGTRKAQAISKISFAGILKLNSADEVEEIRLAVGSVAPISLRCCETERVLEGKKLTEETVNLARKTLEKEITPISDIRSTAHYRLRVCGNLLADFLRTVG